MAGPIDSFLGGSPLSVAIRASEKGRQRDSPPVLVTALTTESSRWTTTSGDGATVHVCTDVDFRLIVGDLLAKLRGHERLRDLSDDQGTT